VTTLQHPGFFVCRTLVGFVPMSYAASARPLIPPDLEALLRRGAFFASSSHVPRLEEQRLLELLGRGFDIAVLLGGLHQ
jgi:hypothetical protein